MDYQAVVEAFNTICRSLPKVRDITEPRKKAIRWCVKQVEEAGGFRALFERVEASDFLTGRNGNWSGCGFDWIWKPANLTKILEGNYDNRPSAGKGAGASKAASDSSLDLEEYEKMVLDYVPVYDEGGKA